MKTVLDPLTDRVNEAITDDKTMLVTMCVFLGVGVLGYIACHFMPKNRGHPR